MIVKRYLQTIGLATIAAWSCRSPDKAAGAGPSELRAAAAGPCAGDTLVYALALHQGETKKSQLKLAAAGITGPLPTNVTEPNAANNVRLELCAGAGDDVAVTSLEYRASPAAGGASLRFTSSDTFEVEDLPRLMNNEEGGSITATDKQGRSVILRAAGELTYALQVARGSSAAGWTAVSKLAVVGDLAEGDPFVAGGPARCQDGGQPEDASFALGTAKFQAKFCAVRASGETSGYQIVELAVTDTNPSLSAAQRQTVTLQGEALARALDYRWVHHNACDSFHLDLGHVAYAATSAPNAGCGGTVAQAPKRSLDDRLPGTVYVARYPGASWSAPKNLPACPHYMRSCGG